MATILGIGVGFLMAFVYGEAGLAGPVDDWVRQISGVPVDTKTILGITAGCLTTSASS